jgi:hypothetical protein
LVIEFAEDVANRPDELVQAMGRFPLSLFDDTRKYLGFKRAVALIEHGDVQDLAQRIQLTEHLFSDSTPFYQLSELAKHVNDFAEFLKTHQRYLIATGLPPYCFRPCRWLYVHLGRLYDTRTTESPYPYDEFRRSGNQDRDPYQWVRAQRKMQPAPNSSRTSKRSRRVFSAVPDECVSQVLCTLRAASSLRVPCRYEDADLLGRMKKDDAERIERERSRMFDLKLRIVELLAKAAKSGNANGLRKTCLDALTHAFRADEVEFYFRMDDYYIGANSIRGVEFSPSAEWSPGGLTNILEVLGHCEAELTHKMYDEARRSIPKAVFKRLAAANQHRTWRYLDVVDSPRRREFDVMIDTLLAKAVTTQGFRAEFLKWLKDSLGRDFKVLVPIEMLPRHAEPLRHLIQDQANVMQEKRERGDFVIGLPNGRNIFRRDGNSWTIQFEGKIIPKPDADGWFYIAQLLRCPKRVLSAFDLRELHVAWGADPTGWLRSNRVQELLAAEGQEAADRPDALHLQAKDSGDLIDKAGRKKFKKELSELTKRHEYALQQGDEGAATEFAEEIKQIKSFMREGTRPSRKRVMLSDENKKANDAVRNAIERVLGDLADAHSELSEHFRKYLKYGGTYCYFPQPSVEWDL